MAGAQNSSASKQSHAQGQLSDGKVSTKNLDFYDMNQKLQQIQAVISKLRPKGTEDLSQKL